ncbi:MAG: Holliday junction branch migration protein RuvA [Tissierellia bacterium]|nr:Holliday junction branch migration protein RuvA [Tissierellia bacterium]
MFAYIIGDVKAKKEEYIVLDNGGIGYKIFTSYNTIKNLNTYDNVMIYTEFVVRDDGVYIYGFDTERELDMFKKLTTVSSIGPKVGLSILSTLTVDEIKYAIFKNEIDILTKAPGIGKKTASRIILELKDKIDEDFVVDNKEEIAENKDTEFAVDALVNLGYMKNDVVNFIKKLDDPDMPIEEIIKQAMKTLEYKG